MSAFTNRPYVPAYPLPTPTGAATGWSRFAVGQPVYIRAGFSALLGEGDRAARVLASPARTGQWHLRLAADDPTSPLGAGRSVWIADHWLDALPRAYARVRVDGRYMGRAGARPGAGSAP